jgi:hypothetical protein
VHKRSKHADAVPLLFCHTWPSSFIEAEKVVDALTDPQEVMGYGAGAQMAFHVVVPSIPGFGFSDAAGSEGFGVAETAKAFDAVMVRLGYAYLCQQRSRLDCAQMLSMTANGVVVGTTATLRMELDGKRRFARMREPTNARM